MTDQAPNSRIALSAMPSKTGWTSAGAPAITVRISAVAAWRSSASLSACSSRALFARSLMSEA